eukprot:CAMPEP_0197872132 /NCGR_PEP_ID=MMETSP1439-20131203/2312_1 /TAXON_ID=66791 /ORGANISM="Gonyaulax spinifera, Strain CCMP409" /LENGTH=1261 /DNA_ID=CAMNT_0043491105 /DNA_START=56 /DNA_END=3841 /DNA_ORIENTATION=-
MVLTVVALLVTSGWVSGAGVSVPGDVHPLTEDQSTLFQKKVNTHTHEAKEFSKLEGTDDSGSFGSLMQTWITGALRDKFSFLVTEPAGEHMATFAANTLDRALLIADPESQVKNKLMKMIKDGEDIMLPMFVESMKLIVPVVKRARDGQLDEGELQAVAAFLTGVEEDTISLFGNFGPREYPISVGARLALHVGSKLVNHFSVMQPQHACYVHYADQALKNGGGHDMVLAIRSLAAASRQCNSQTTEGDGLFLNLMRRVNSSLGDETSAKTVHEVLRAAAADRQGNPLPEAVISFFDKASATLEKAESPEEAGKTLAEKTASFLRENGDHLGIPVALQEMAGKTYELVQERRYSLSAPTMALYTGIRSIQHRLHEVADYTGLSREMVSFAMVAGGSDSSSEEAEFIVGRTILKLASDFCKDKYPGSHMISSAFAKLHANLYAKGDTKERDHITRTLTHDLLQYVFRNSSLAMVPTNIQEAVTTGLLQVVHRTSATFFRHDMDEEVMSQSMGSKWKDDIMHAFSNRPALLALIGNIYEWVTTGITAKEASRGKLGKTIVLAAKAMGEDSTFQAYKSVVSAITQLGEKLMAGEMPEMKEVVAGGLSAYQDVKNIMSSEANMHQLPLADVLDVFTDLLKEADPEATVKQSSLLDIQDDRAMADPIGKMISSGKESIQKGAAAVGKRAAAVGDALVAATNSLQKKSMAAMMALPGQIMGMFFLVTGYPFIQFVQQPLILAVGNFFDAMVTVIATVPYSFFYMLQGADAVRMHIPARRTKVFFLDDFPWYVVQKYKSLSDMNEWLFGHKIACEAYFAILFAQFGLFFLGLNNIMNFETLWEKPLHGYLTRPENKQDRDMIFSSFVFLWIAKHMEVSANSIIMERSCSEKAWDLNYPKESEEKETSVNVIKAYATTRVAAGVAFTIFGSLAAVGMKKWKMPSPGWYGDLLPITAFSGFSMAQVKVIFEGTDGSDFSFYDLGPGPIPMRMAQLVDNLASLGEPIFYMLYSRLAAFLPVEKSEDYWARMQEVPCAEAQQIADTAFRKLYNKTTYNVSYCDATYMAQLVNVVSGVSTVVVNAIGLVSINNFLEKKSELDTDTGTMTDGRAFNIMLYNGGDWHSGTNPDASSYLREQGEQVHFYTRFVKHIAHGDKPDLRCLVPSMKRVLSFCDEEYISQEGGQEAYYKRTNDIVEAKLSMGTQAWISSQKAWKDHNEDVDGRSTYLWPQDLVNELEEKVVGGIKKITLGCRKTEECEAGQLCTLGKCKVN